MEGCAAYSLDGTPVDCVKVALEHILEEKPDFVFSGINNGYNAGFDIAYSGTLGAAFEATRAGIPAIAFSVAADSHLEAVRSLLPEVIRELLEGEREPGAVGEKGKWRKKTGRRLDSAVPAWYNKMLSYLLWREYPFPHVQA